jgi:NADH-quinone oxidoreductase subunit N
MIAYLVALLLFVASASVMLLATRPLDRRPIVPASLALVTALVAFMLFAVSFPQTAVLLGMVRTGGLASLGGMVLSLIAALTLLGVMANPDKYRAGLSEFYAFVLYATLGGILMVAANNLLLLYVALELSSYSTYILVGYYRNDRYSTEAANKYFVLGALSSAILLYGFSFLFGAGGGLYYDELAGALVGAQAVPTSLWLGMALTLVGVGFKLALVPFHAWTPDAYQGAPTMVAALLSVGPKAAAVIAFGALFTQVFAAEALAAVWQGAFAWLAVLTMTVGNLQALRQRNLKRLLGFSSIAQLGTVVVGLAAGSEAGFQAVVFYAFGYALANIGAFSAIALLRDGGVREELFAYAGLGRRQPAVALLLTLFLLSLAGAPLLVGFAAKLFVFASAIDAGLVPLVAVAIANTVLAFAYYFRVIGALWLEEVAERAPLTPVPALGLVALGMCAAGVVLFGVLPSVALELIAGALSLWP